MAIKRKPKGDVHLFTTKHPYFIELGLGSFTLGTLIEWWNQKSAEGFYLNRRHITGIDSTNFNHGSLANLLFGSQLPDYTEISWEGWKPNIQIENAGIFKKQTLHGLGGNQAGSDNEWKYEVNTIHPIAHPNSLASLFMTQSPIIGVNPQTLLPLYAQHTYYDPLKSLKVIYALIQLNKYMVSFEAFKPRAKWVTTDPTTYAPLSKEAAFGSWALLTEIKAAKAGAFVQWTAPITFYVDTQGLAEGCQITENITFQLYLGDQSMINVGNNAVATKNLVLVGPKLDAFGAAPGLDGERVQVSQNDIANHTAAPIALQYNTVTKSLQSGNVNSLAKLVTDLKPAQVPELKHLLTADIKESLDDASNKNSYIPSLGSGMPIRAQNGSPLQWYPSYALTQDSRCSASGEKKNEKQIVPVYNFNPRRYYASGEEVLITYIDGMWHVSSLGEPNVQPSGEDQGVTAGIGKWGSFTYLATSYQFFFKDSNGAKLTPRDAELNFHKIFYSKASQEDKGLNYDTAYTPSEGGYDTSQPFNTYNYMTWSDKPGWYQITSFDFLDTKINGIRSKAGLGGANTDKCSISSTSATLNSAGNIIPFDNSNYSNRNSAHTGTFFGCVFPNGYRGTEVYDNPNRESSWTIAPTYIGSISWQNYFSNSQFGNPFLDSQDRNNANAKCAATETDPFKPILLDEAGFLGDNNWSRGTNKPDANMFFLKANNGRKTIPADVMLNASPKGKNGSPIKPIGLFRDMNSNNWTIDGSAYLGNLVNGGVWLARRSTTQNFDGFSSAFDFEPRSKSNLMFRPLKLEAYLQLGIPTRYALNWGSEDDWSINPNPNEPNFDNLSLANVQKQIQGFWTEAARTQMDGKFPISYYVPMREFENCKHNLAGFEKGIHEVGGPLKWGAWLPAKPAYSKIHMGGYWDDQLAPNSIAGMQWTKNIGQDPWKYDNQTWKGAGAFGVITTNLKVKANSKIEFTTKNLYGMSTDSYFFSTFFDPDGTWRHKAAWGVGNFIDSYKQENIADLSVRIYQGHPSEATLYDPRYFAVHHFNPGVEYIYDQYYGGDIPRNTLAQQVGFTSRNALEETFKNIRGQNGDVLAGVRYVYPDASGVDIKWPSRYQYHLNHLAGTAHQATNQNQWYVPVALDFGTVIFSDGTMNGTTLQPQLLPEKYWLVDTRRTGKLLPYRYYIPNIEAPVNNAGPITMVSEASRAGQFAHLNARILIVKNSGQNYKIADKVGNEQYNVEFLVSATGDGGVITELVPLQLGDNLPLNFAQPSGARIGDLTPTFNITGIPTLSQGTGFSAYFVATALGRKFTCDKKPFLIKTDGETGDEIVRIAADVSAPTISDSDKPGSVGANEATSYVDKSYTTAFNITDLVKSKDGSYDIFFHFHNDISFTWLACGSNMNGKPHGNQFNISECTEQHITIEKINLT